MFSKRFHIRLRCGAKTMRHIGISPLALPSETVFDALLYTRVLPLFSMVNIWSGCS